ncbi:MAG: acyl-CoA desaturase [Chloroflexia bacterium]
MQNTQARPATSDAYAFPADVTRSATLTPADIETAIQTPIDTAIAPKKARSDYATLVELVRAEGLLAPQPRYYTFKIISTMLMVASGIAFLLVFDNIWLRLFSAAFLAVAFSQIGFLGHDTGHLAVFWGRRKRGQHIALGLISANLLLGMSFSWWRDKHNAHHADPNVLDVDPDISIPLISFSEDKLAGKSKAALFITQYQAFFFYPMLILAALDLQISSVKYLWRNRIKQRWLEAVTLAAHQILYFVGIPMAIGFWPGIGFMVLHQALFGIILGSSFAPNHKGMPTLKADEEIDFLRKQVITARSVKGGKLVDFLYGGLNNQAVHHCFTNMPRNNLRRACVITRRFCEEHGIPYYETGVFQSFREIIVCLNDVGKAARDVRLARRVQGAKTGV